MVKDKSITDVGVLALQLWIVGETRLRAFDAAEEISNLFWRLKSTKDIEKFETIIFLTGYLSSKVGFNFIEMVLKHQPPSLRKSIVIKVDEFQ